MTQRTREGQWRAVYAPKRIPPLLVPAPLTQQPDRHASRRVMWHRYTDDPDASGWHQRDAPRTGWAGPVTVDGLWTCSAPHPGPDGRLVVRVLPEWEHYAAIRGDASPVPFTVPARECWVLTTVPDTGDWDGTEGAFGLADAPTVTRVVDPHRPPTRRMRYGANEQAMVGARAVLVTWSRDQTDPDVDFGWRIVSEPYAEDTTLPNTRARDVDELDRPLLATFVRCCREDAWFETLATGRPLAPTDLVPMMLPHVFLE